MEFYKTWQKTLWGLFFNCSFLFIKKRCRQETTIFWPFQPCRITKEIKNKSECCRQSRLLFLNQVEEKGPLSVTVMKWWSPERITELFLLWDMKISHDSSSVGLKRSHHSRRVSDWAEIRTLSSHLVFLKELCFRHFLPDVNFSFHSLVSLSFGWTGSVHFFLSVWLHFTTSPLSYLLQVYSWSMIHFLLLSSVSADSLMLDDIFFLNPRLIFRFNLIKEFVLELQITVIPSFLS